MKQLVKLLGVVKAMKSEQEKARSECVKDLEIMSLQFEKAK